MIKRFYFLAVLMIFISGCGTDTKTTPKTETPFAFEPFETSKSVVENKGMDVLQIKTNENNVTYSINQDHDGDLFKIDKISGSLSFKTVPDFENPKDNDKNNIYEITVKAVNDKNETLSKKITITVINDTTDDGPILTSPNTVSLEENRQLDFTIKAQSNNSVGFVFMLSAGEDKAKFELNNSSGSLSFNSFIPDFDNPSDFDKNNRYEIVVKVTDDQNISTEQNITVAITDDENDLVPTRIVFKTGQDDGRVKGLAFGNDRVFKVHEENGDKALIFGERMWEDSEHVINTPLDFEGANDYCAGLDYAGYDDWRAPNRHELAELINYGKKGILFDDDFKYKKGGNFWTSQERLSSTNDHSKAWSISFTDGEEYDEPKGSNFNIRCVRGKKIEDHNDFTRKGDIVIDNKTAFMWQNAEFTGKKTWQEAIDHCKNLVFAGYSDWRLPNVNELRTIMPKDSDEILFENLSPISLDSGHAWSSTTADETHARYNLNFWDLESDRDSLIMMYEGQTKDQNDDTMLNRCIRGGHL